MKITEFKSGQWVQEYQYKSFSPNHINHSWMIDDEQLSFMLNQWLRFFLEGVIQTAESSIDTFKKIIAMKEDIEQNKITKLGKKIKTAQSFLLYLFGQPIVDSEDVANAMNINVSTGLRLINDFIELGILKEMTGFKRNRIFKFDEYIHLFE